MGKKKKTRRGSDSSSSSESLCDDLSTEEATPPRSSSHAHPITKARRTNRNKEDKVIRILEQMRIRSKKHIEDTSKMQRQLNKLIEDTSKMQRQLNKLIESHNELRQQLEPHINGSSGDDSSAPRSETNQVQQLPKYRLEFTCQVNHEIEKGQIIETTKNGKTISVAICDDHNQIVTTEPFASATVMLVVVKGEFNRHGNQYNWSKQDFERNITRPKEDNKKVVVEPSDEHQALESIVSNCVFKLVDGVGNHSGSTILYNSGNKKVRLGVTVLWPTKDRVLEGLSNPFFVRGHDRPAKRRNPQYSQRKRQKQTAVGFGSDEGDGPMLIMQNPTSTNVTQPEETRSNPTLAAAGVPGNTVTYAIQQQAPIQQQQFARQPGTSMAPTTYNLSGGGEQLHFGSRFEDLYFAPYNISMGDDSFPVPTNGTDFNMDRRAFPLQLIWDRPNMQMSKRWNLLDQLMPLYSFQQKFNNCGLSSMCLGAENLGSLNIVPKDFSMHTHRKRDVLIEPLEPDDSNEERPLKRKLHRRYLLRFVNKVCEAYYTWEQIKDSDGNLLKVALFDENNTKITFGPLSSASVEMVVLHGDFNVDDKNYWSSEEFNRSIVHQQPRQEASSVLEGDRILVLNDGEARLSDAFFRITSRLARTGKFKMGVMLANAQDERIQEGISEPFWVKDRRMGVLHGKYGPTHKDLPPGFRFCPTDEELIVHYLLPRASGKLCAVPIMADVDIYKYDPWHLPDIAVFRGEQEWCCFCPWKGIHPNILRTCRTTISGYWKAIGANRPIYSTGVGGKLLGKKKTLVFYKGRAPVGTRTTWVMHEYHLDPTWATTNGNTSSSSIMKLDEWVLCRIFNNKPIKGLQLSPSMYDDKDPEFLELPPGFHFRPTDEELILHYLRNRATAAPCPVPIFADVDEQMLDPWELPTVGYFCHSKEHNFSTGTRFNHATKSGYWIKDPENEDDKTITLSAADNKIIGFRTTLSFYTGRAPKGVKTSWMMHEYRLADITFSSTVHSAKQGEWLLRRIYKKGHLQAQPREADSVYNYMKIAEKLIWHC